MQLVRGIYLPKGDEHFAGHLMQSEFDGKGAYQLNKIEAACGECVLAQPNGTMGEIFGTALDIGGHVGLWSRVLAAVFTKVIAYEPVPELQECFRLNTADCPNVHLRPYALGPETGMCDYVHTFSNSGNSFVMKGEGSAHMHRLDAVIGSGEKIKLIKIDVEGFEFHVIKGAEQTIRHHKPVMVVEQKPGNAERYGLGRFDATDLLESWGARKLWVKSGDYCYGWR